MAVFNMANNVLKIEDLHVSFDTYAGEVQAVRGVSYHVDEGEVLAVVGESGCGKSVTAQTIMKLNPMPPARIKGGAITLNGMDIVNTPEKEMENIRGKDVAMIFQDPMTSLNPTMKVGKQLTESIIKHERAAIKAYNKAKKADESGPFEPRKLDKKLAYTKAIELLKLVQIPNAEQRASQYPYQFSGGMRQRVMIAMALACSPKLLIADEPTTALDVTIQAQIIDLLKDIREKTGTAIILITHDLGVVANLAQRVVVMYGGRIMESASVQDIFYNPSHPYTLGLLESLPSVGTEKGEKLSSIPGTPPNLLNPPVGCEFAARCKYCMQVCLDHRPEPFDVSDNHTSSCWLHHSSCPIKNEVNGRDK